MKRTSRIRQALSRFRTDRKGSVGVMYALSILPVLGAAGIAIDYVRISAAETQLQSALDAATLSAAAIAAPGTTDAMRVVAANQDFILNMKSGSTASMESLASFKVASGKVTGEASVKVPMSFMRLLGTDEVAPSATTTVNIASTKKAEVVLALDYSGSMKDSLSGGTKYVIMRNAASKLVEDLSSSMKERVRFGLVPFSHHVYTSLPGAYVLGGGSDTWTGCTQDRPYPANIGTQTPGNDAASKWGQPQAEAHKDSGCAGYISNQLKVMDLTNVSGAVTGQLSAMKPYAWTHIALGAEFAYHMLTPNAPFTKAAAMDDSQTVKVMVLLTDGEQTEPAFGPGNSRNVAQGEKNLEAICKAAKADGITVITMAFDLPDASTRKRLKDCATDPAQDFFVANDAASLSRAFEAVENTVTAEVYISR